MYVGKADLHVHSSFSFDSSTSIRVALDQAANRAGLDVIAITDHDTLEGAWQAQELAGDYDIEVITGCEISTRQGHLLALFLSKPVPRGLSLERTIGLVGEQGGLCIAAHPMAPHVASLRARHILAAAAHPDLRRVLVGVETINACLPYDISNRWAAALCRQAGLAPTGSSDAHMGWAIGTAVTQFHGRGAEDLRQALVQGATQAMRTTAESPLNFWGGGNLYHMARRLLGWTVWSPKAGAAYQWRRLAEVR
ncbi:MAG: PHP domain-containing protein [Anaerolineales bacterium]|nr:PHP domain-containing protein [Anaerolineales bacterium]